MPAPAENARFEVELRTAAAAVRAAGAEVERLRREGVRYGSKSDEELVSEADIRAAEMLHQALTGAFPGDGWLSEEHVDTRERLDCDRVWVVDPVDGTREYLLGVPEFAISVGLVVEGRPVLGAVYNPANNELHAAVCDGIPERGPSRLIRPFVVLAGRAEQRWGEVPPLPREARVHGVGSLAYRLALVAAGTGDAVLTQTPRSEWDIAAGAALCLAAGLRVTNAYGEPLRFNQPDPKVPTLLVAEPGLHQRLRYHLRERA
jgi:myo-inositol-1(or 4)-monophosphatase